MSHIEKHKLSERQETLLSIGVKTVGLEDAIAYIQEELYTDEYPTIKLFLEWVNKEWGFIGPANRQSLWRIFHKVGSPEDLALLEATKKQIESWKH